MPLRFLDLSETSIDPVVCQVIGEAAMDTSKREGRNLKRRVFDLLNSSDLNRGLHDLCRLPARRVINPLFSFLCNSDQEVRWRAITAMGVVVANLAENDMESSRVVMRRLMWSLSHESGGVGWGAPEAMGEIMACHEGLAKEYVHILISYIMQDGNLLEHELLQRGVVWGLGRLAQVRPHLVQDAVPYLRPYLESGDATVRGLAAWTIGLLGAEAACSQLESLLEDNAEIQLYLNRKLVACRVSELAEQALTALKRSY